MGREGEQADQRAAETAPVLPADGAYVWMYNNKTRGLLYE